MAIVRRVILRGLASRRRGWMWSRWYDYLNRRFDRRPVWFMNYGFLPPDGPPLPLDPQDEPNRISIQLYHRVVGKVDLSGSDVLEVSCGRGGGARFIQQYLRPRRMIALDFAKEGLRLCAAHHADRAVRFVCGDAMQLPFPAGSFDAVVNVEASHCYPDFGVFLAEVRRVLRPGGRLLYADMRRVRNAAGWRDQLLGAGLVLEEEEDLTTHVANALDVSDPTTRALVTEIAPRWLRRGILGFAGTRNSRVFRALREGRLRYVRFVLRKSAEAETTR